MITCTFDNGNQAKLRHVVVDVVAINNGQILLVKRAPGIFQGGKWALPGGYVERDELVVQGAERELKEETGYTAQVLKFIKYIDNPDRGDDRQNVSFLYEASNLEKNGEADNESSEVSWFTLDALPPDSDFAFDHASIIKQYKEALK